MIKHAEIHKIKIENEIRYVAKIYIDREEIEDESFSSPTFEETAKYVLKDCVISSLLIWRKWRDNNETQGRNIKIIIQNQSRTGQKESIDESNYICKS